MLAGAGTKVLICAAAMAVCAPLAEAAEPSLERSWSKTEASAGADVLTPGANVAPYGPGGSVVTYSVDRSFGGPGLRAAIKPAGATEFEPAETLDNDAFDPTLDGTQRGGAVAAWYYGPTRDVLFAELLPGEAEWEIPYLVDSTQADFSRNRPQVDVGESGHAIVAYLARDPAGSHQLMVATRQPDAEFFDVPVAIGPPEPAHSIHVTDVEVGFGGAFAIGFVADEHAKIAIRPAGGTWGEPTQLGEQAPTYSWTVPRVGVDGLGNVAAAWLERDSDGESGPVRLAYSLPEGGFGAPRETSLSAVDGDAVELAVSAQGETVLMVEASESDEPGSWGRRGTMALYGNTIRREAGPPSVLAGHEASNPLLAMNGRGDAIVAWDKCCPLRLEVRRRGPFSSFGPAVDVQEPVELSAVRGGIWANDADVDEFSEGRLTWIDSDPDADVKTDDPAIVYVGEDLPVLDNILERVTDPGSLAPVVPPSPPSTDPDPPADQDPPPQSFPPPPPPPPHSDRQAPLVKVGLGGIRPRRGQVTLRMSCDEPCRVDVAAKLGGGLKLGPVRVSLPPGAAQKVALSPRGRLGAIKRELRREPSIRVHGSATDLSGNVATVRERFEP